MIIYHGESSDKTTVKVAIKLRCCTGIVLVVLLLQQRITTLSTIFMTPEFYYYN